MGAKTIHRGIPSETARAVAYIKSADESGEEKRGIDFCNLRKRNKINLLRQANWLPGLDSNQRPFD